MEEATRKKLCETIIKNMQGFNFNNDKTGKKFGKYAGIIDTYSKKCLHKSDVFEVRIVATLTKNLCSSAGKPVIGNDIMDKIDNTCNEILKTL